MKTSHPLRAIHNTNRLRRLVLGALLWLAMVPMPARAQQFCLPLWDFNPPLNPTGAALSPDGALVAMGTMDGIDFYSTATQLPFRQISPHVGSIMSFQLSPAGSTVAIVMQLADSTEQIQLWDYELGKLLGVLTPTETTINTVTFSPTGTMLATGGLQANASTSTSVGLIEQWNLSTKSRISLLKPNATAVNSVAYTGNGKLLAEGGVNGKVASMEVWNPHTNARVAVLSPGDLTTINQVVCPPATTTVSAYGKTGKGYSVSTWNTLTTSEISEVGIPAQMTPAAILSPDASQILSATVSASGMQQQYSQTTTVELWNITQSQSPLQSWNANWQVTGLAFSADGSRCVFAGTIDTWISLGYELTPIPTAGYYSIDSAATGSNLAQNSLTAYGFYGPSNAYVIPSFSPSGNLVAGGGTDYGKTSGAVNVWNARNGSLAAAIPTQATGGSIFTSFSADDRWMALYTFQGTTNGTQIWDLETSTLTKSLGGSIPTAPPIFSPDGKKVAIACFCAGGYNTVQIWDFSAGQLLETLQTAANQGIVALAFSKDGSQLALGGSYIPSGSTGSPSGVLELWNVITGHRSLELATKESVVEGVTLSPDGRTLLASGQISLPTTSMIGSIEAWNLPTGHLSTQLPLYPGTSSVTSTLYSKSGDMIYAVTLGALERIQVIEPLRGRLLGYLNLSNPFIALSPGAGMAASAGGYLGLNVSTIPALETASLKSIQFDSAAISDGGTATGTIRLNAPAPAGGATVGLEASGGSTSDGYLSIPTVVTIPSGSSSAAFTVQGFIQEESTAYTVTAISGTHTVSTTLSIVLPSLASFTLSASQVVGGNSVTGTITLNNPPANSAWYVNLVVVGTAATVPASVSFASGVATATFTITTSAVSSPQVVTISTTVWAVTKSVTLTVNPPGT